LSQKAVRSVREGGTSVWEGSKVCQGRRYGLSGKAIRSVREGSTVCQGRQYGPSGKAVRSVREGSMVRQGRQYGLSGKAVWSVRAGGTDRPSQYINYCLVTPLQLSWAGRSVGASSLRPSTSVVTRPPYHTTLIPPESCTNMQLRRKGLFSSFAIYSMTLPHHPHAFMRPRPPSLQQKKIKKILKNNNVYFLQTDNRRDNE
jgi:hypothetical protein